MPYVLLKEPVFIDGRLVDAQEYAEVTNGLASNLINRGKAELLPERNTSSETPAEPEPEPEPEKKAKPAKGKKQS